MTIAFCGHRNVNVRFDYCILKIESILWDLCEYEKDLEFLCGGYGEFDAYCEEVLISLRRNPDFPPFRLCRVLPYPHIKHLNKLGKFYDELIYPELDDVFFKQKIVERNYWMVKNCDVLIAYVTDKRGGAAQMLKQAVKLKKRIIYVDFATY